MANQTYTIRLEDGTEDRRFSSANTSEEAVKSATTTKTEPAAITASTPKAGTTPGSGQAIAAAVGKKALASSPAGPVVAKASGIVAMATNPVALSLAAFALAQQAFNHWRRYEQERNQWRNTHAIQYGVTDRGNLRNQRTTLITGRLKGESTGGRR